MKNNNLTKEGVDTKVYTPPVTRERLIDTKRVVCASETETETEKVDDIDGEW